MRRGPRLLRAAILALAFATGCERAARDPEPPPARDPQDTLFRVLPEGGAAREIPVRVFLPVGYRPDRRWPVVLFFHGSGEIKGEDLAPTRVGLPLMLRAHPERLGAIVVIPQLRGTMGLVARRARLAARSLDDVIARYHGDPERVTVTGTSMGAWAAMQVAMDEPRRYAALLLFAGGACPNCVPAQPPESLLAYQAAHLTGIPLWIWHGDADQHVPIDSARKFVEALRQAGADIRYTEVPGGPHNIWDPAYADTAVIGWLMRQHRTGAAHGR